MFIHATFSRKSSLKVYFKFYFGILFQAYFLRKQSIFWKNFIPHIRLIFTCRITSCRSFTPVQSGINHIQVRLTNLQIRFSRERRVIIRAGFILFSSYFFIKNRPLKHVIRPDRYDPFSFLIRKVNMVLMFGHLSLKHTV